MSDFAAGYAYGGMILPRRLGVLSTVGFALPLLAACGGRVAPPPKPPPSLPTLTMDPAPPVPGMGRIAISAVGVNGEPGPFAVWREITSSTNVQLESSTHVCGETPCVANLPYGNWDLRISNSHGLYGQVSVVVTEKPSVLNVVVGCFDPGIFSDCFQAPSYVQWQPRDGVIYRATQ